MHHLREYEALVNSFILGLNEAAEISDRFSRDLNGTLFSGSDFFDKKTVLIDLESKYRLRLYKFLMDVSPAMSAFGKEPSTESMINLLEGKIDSAFLNLLKTACSKPSGSEASIISYANGLFNLFMGEEIYKVKASNDAALLFKKLQLNHKKPLIVSGRSVFKYSLNCVNSCMAGENDYYFYHHDFNLPELLKGIAIAVQAVGGKKGKEIADSLMSTYANLNNKSTVSYTANMILPVAEGVFLKFYKYRIDLNISGAVDSLLKQYFAMHRDAILVAA